MTQSKFRVTLESCSTILTRPVHTPGFYGLVLWWYYVSVFVWLPYIGLGPSTAFILYIFFVRNSSIYILLFKKLIQFERRRNNKWIVVLETKCLLVLNSQITACVKNWQFRSKNFILIFQLRVSLRFRWIEYSLNMVNRISEKKNLNFLLKK